MNNNIAIFGGGLHKNKNGKWRTTNFNEGDNFGADGSAIRVLAAYFLHKDDLNTRIIASGGKGQYKSIPDAPNISSIIKEELMKMGVSEKKILEEKKSNNTYQQLKECYKIIKKNKIKNLTIISNKYHLPRIIEMIKTNNELYELFNKNIIRLESAEKIVLKNSPKKWKPIINRAYKSKSMKDRIILEKKGIKDIKNGTYKLK